MTPIFYSEVSSSYLLFDIFKKNEDVTEAFIKDYYGLEKADILQVFREKSYPKKGSIDLFITFNANDRKCVLLIEAKVHDYISVKDDQIRTYYEAVLEDSRYDEIYFIYLTTFNEETDFTDTAEPKSLAEARRGRDRISEGFLHLTWIDVHAFLEKHRKKLNEEQQMMVDLHRTWIVEKRRTDLAANVVETGERSIEDYLGDVSAVLEKIEPLGREVMGQGRLKLQIELNELDDEKLETVYQAIRDLAKSENVNQKREFQTEEDTLTAAAKFLSELVGNGIDNEWALLRFYTGLFRFANETSFLRFNGKDSFSIRLDVIDKGEISLCTLWRKKRSVEFSLRR